MRKNIYFNLSEFDSPDVKGSGALMDDTFIDMLIDARALANIPFIISSGYRTEKHNKKVGGVKNSSHLKGLAVDIKCTDSISRFIILNALQQVGFNRIGIAKSFIHCDIDIDKPKNVIWTY
jgi:zinc D-Ala-D-Ala carboxypeptidase